MDISKLSPQQIIRMKNEMAAERLGNAMMTTLVPAERTPDIWRELAQTAICKSSPLGSGLNFTEYAKLLNLDFLNGAGHFTLFQLGILSNAMEALSFESSGLSADDYSIAVGYAQSGANYYNAQLRELKDKVQLETESKFLVMVQRMPDPKGPALGSLRSIKAQA